MSNLGHTPDLHSLCAEAEAARAAGDLPAAAFAYAVAITLLPPTGKEQAYFELRLARAACLHGAGDYEAEAEELVALDVFLVEHPDPVRYVMVTLRRAALQLVNGEAAAAQLTAATALAAAQTLESDALVAESLLLLAQAAHLLNDFVAACDRAEKALQLYLLNDDLRGEAAARRMLGLVIHSMGGNAIGQLRIALELSRVTGDQAGEAMALNAIGVCTTDRAEARAVYIQGLAIAESSGDRQSEATLANNLGGVYLSLGLYRQARAYAMRAVRLARALGARDMLATFLEYLGRAAGDLGQAEHARVAFREAYALAESLGNHGTAANSLICLARTALAEGRHAEAAVDLDRAAALCAAIGATADEANALAWRAATHLACGEYEAARSVSARAVALVRRGGAFPVQEVWWQRYRALVAPLAEHGAAPELALAADIRGNQAALEALANARDTMFAAIASLSDAGLRRSYLGRVAVNRAIIEALALVANDGALDPPAPPAVSHTSLQDQLKRLLGVTARLSDLRDAAVLRELFLDELIELCGAERVLLFLGPSLVEPEAFLYRGITPGELPMLRHRALPLVLEAAHRGRALTSELQGDEGDKSPPVLRPRSAIVVPLISGTRTVGAFYADVRRFFGPFGGGDLDLIGLLAVQAATALENARLYAQTLRAKEDLERQVAERTADLRAANQSLSAHAAEAQAARASAETASAAKSVFLANVSHELRTPLNAVIGFAQVLQRDDGLSERQRELLAIIGRSGDHLLGLINDVLELSKIEAGRLGVSPTLFDLHALLLDLDGLFRLRAEVKRLEFTVRLDPGVPRFVIGDEGRLRQVLLNLVGNALKFTHAGRIEVVAVATPEDAHLRLRITVADTGEGMRPDELAMLFRPFSQTESGRRAKEGTGLGLALSRQLARLMGGDIIVTSMPGTGSSFSLNILVDPAAAPLEPFSKQRVIGLLTAGRRYRALIALAQWQTRRLFAEWLRAVGIEVHEASDGAQALSGWAAWRPHIMLLDTQLPLIDGLEAARRVRESPVGRSTVLIAVSNDPAPASVPGCDEVLARSVDHDELLICIARHLGLDLRYAAEPSADKTSRLTRGDLAELPPALREQLAAAAASSDPAIIAAMLDHLAESWPNLVARLRALADEFQFDTIELLASDE